MPINAKYERIKEILFPADGVTIIWIINESDKIDSGFLGKAPITVNTPRRYIIAARLRLGIEPTKKQ